MRELSLHETISISGGAAPVATSAAPTAISGSKYPVLEMSLYEWLPWVAGGLAAYHGAINTAAIAGDKIYYGVKVAPLVGAVGGASCFVGAFLAGQLISGFIKS